AIDKDVTRRSRPAPVQVDLRALVRIRDQRQGGGFDYVAVFDGPVPGQRSGIGRDRVGGELDGAQGDYKQSRPVLRALVWYPAYAEGDVQPLNFGNVRKIRDQR